MDVVNSCYFFFLPFSFPNILYPQMGETRTLSTKGDVGNLCSLTTFFYLQALVKMRALIFFGTIIFEIFFELHNIYLNEKNSVSIFSSLYTWQYLVLFIYKFLNCLLGLKLTTSQHIWSLVDLNSLAQCTCMSLCKRIWTKRIPGQQKCKQKKILRDHWRAAGMQTCSDFIKSSFKSLDE